MGLWDSITGAFSSVGNKINNLFGEVWSTGKGIVTQVINTPKDIAKVAGDTVGKVAEQAANLGKGLGDSAATALGNLSLPLTIGIGVAGIFLIMNMNK